MAGLQRGKRVSETKVVAGLEGVVLMGAGVLLLQESAGVCGGGFAGEVRLVMVALSWSRLTFHLLNYQLLAAELNFRSGTWAKILHTVCSRSLTIKRSPSTEVRWNCSFKESL